MNTVVLQILPLVLEIIAVLLGLALLWLSKLASSRFGLSIEGKHRDALHRALMSGVQLVAARVVAQPSNGAVATDPVSIQLGAKDAIVSEVAQYVKDSVPDALAHFGVKDTFLRRMAEAKLNEELTKLQR